MPKLQAVDVSAFSFTAKFELSCSKKTLILSALRGKNEPAFNAARRQQLEKQQGKLSPQGTHGTNTARRRSLTSSAVLRFGVDPGKKVYTF